MKLKYKTISEAIQNGEEIINFQDFKYDENQPKRYNDTGYLEKEMSLLNSIFKILEIFIDEKEIEKKADQLNWASLVSLPSFPEKFSSAFLEKFQHDIPWGQILNQKGISNEFIAKYPQFFDFSEYPLSDRGFTEDELRKIEPYVKDLTYNIVNSKEEISEEFIREYKSKIKLDQITHRTCRNWSLSFFEEFESEINWLAIGHNHSFTEDFLDKFGHLLNWESVISANLLSDRLLEKYGTFILNSFKKRVASQKKNILSNSNFGPSDSITEIPETGGPMVNHVGYLTVGG